MNRLVRARDLEPGDFLTRYRDTAANVSKDGHRVFVTLTNDGDTLVFHPDGEVEIL